MVKEDKATELRQKSKFAAMEALRPKPGFPVPPRKAVSNAKKASKGLVYPVPPYPNTNLLALYRWANVEWKNVGHWQSLAAPIVIIVSLLTWEKEKALQEARWTQIEKEEVRRRAAEIYGAFGTQPRKRKLFGLIPLP